MFSAWRSHAAGPHWISPPMRSQPSNYKITAQMQHIMVLSQIQVEDNNKFGCLRISIFGILRQQQVQLQRTLNWGQTRFNFIWKKIKVGFICSTFTNPYFYF